MKKISILIGLVACLCFSTHASQQVFNSFIPGWNPVPAADAAGDSVAMLLNSNITSGVVTTTNFLNPTLNGLTNLWGSAGVVYVVQGESFGRTYGTNAIILSASNTKFPAGPNIISSTNAQFANPSAVQLYGTNQTFWVAHALGSTNTLGANIDPVYWPDVPVYYDQNGLAIPTTLSAAYGTDQNSTSATNQVTFTFAPVYDGLTLVTNTWTLGGTSAANYCNGTNTVISTNYLSQATLQGVKSIRLIKIVCSTNSLADSVWCYSLGASSAKP